jgi:hypothetical protein
MEPQESSQLPQKNGNGAKVTTGIVAAAIIVVALFGISRYENKSTITPSSATTSSPATVAISSSSSSTKPTSSFKDGTYSAVGSYDTPAGTEHVGVSLTIAGGVVTAADVTSEAVAPESKRYQAMFISGYKTQVIGKNISDLNLDKVSGSSLTPQGFDDAVAQIKTEATA